MKGLCMEEKRIDIILPVFNGFEDLKKCIDSIQRHTDLQKHTLLVLNDCSTDERIKKYLSTLRLSGIYVKNHTMNLGFSANINFGIFLSNRDVVLLNSDTIVTRGWVEKIITAAYSDDNIATVTPLSNNATLCSIPNNCMENEIPSEYSLDEWAAFIEKSSLCLYPTIPTANGFCMYIKRKVIDIIGGFDINAFGRGYGEENDFCYRAIRRGFRNVMCDNVFVYHKGTVSFLPREKEVYIKQHSKILQKRYPECVMKTDNYHLSGESEIITQNLIVSILKNNGKKNLLICFPKRVDYNAINEVGLYYKGFNCYFVYPVLIGYKVGVYYKEKIYNINIADEGGIVFKFLEQGIWSLMVGWLGVNRIIAENEQSLPSGLAMLVEKNEDFIGLFNSYLLKEDGLKNNFRTDLNKLILFLHWSNRQNAYDRLLGKFMEYREMAIGNWEVAEQYRNEAADNWKIAEKYRNEAADNWKVAEKYRNEAADNWKVAEQYRDEAADNWKTVEKYKGMAADNWKLIEKYQRVLKGDEADESKQ